MYSMLPRAGIVARSARGCTIHSIERSACKAVHFDLERPAVRLHTAHSIDTTMHEANDPKKDKYRNDEERNPHFRRIEDDEHERKTDERKHKAVHARRDV